MDKHAPTTYGSTYEVATGPYMLESNLKSAGAFAGIGYQTGKSAVLVRNPNWNPNTYSPAYKPPAYLDRINIDIGGDAPVIGQQVLKGSDSVQLDTPAQSIVKARGGALVAQPMTHFLYPGDQGFEQAGGFAGPQVDYNRDVEGNHAVACKYMKLAGYPDCRYTGGETVQMVSSNNGNDPPISQIVNSALTVLGFTTHVSLVDQTVIYSKYCQVPKQEIDACPAQGWLRDFADPLGTLYAPFYGPSITATGNPNQGQVNVPAINAAMAKAALIVAPAARYRAWAKIDDMLVDHAAAVPEDYDNQPNIESRDVAGVDDLWNEGTWDFAFTSLKKP